MRCDARKTSFNLISFSSERPNPISFTLSTVSNVGTDVLDDVTFSCPPRNANYVTISFNKIVITRKIGCKNFVIVFYSKCY